MYNIFLDTEEEPMFEECPNCGSIWGCEEFDFQSCDCCGYPNNEDEDANNDDDFIEIVEQLNKNSKT